MHYGEPVIRRTVPLALGLLCASNPLVNVLDTLSKYSHDNDNDVAISAIFAMGVVGAGTNNARLAQMLRQLASFYHKDASSLFMVRIAQGLLHMAKGTMTINPFHTDRQIMSPVAVAGLMCSLITMTDYKSCKYYHHITPKSCISLMILYSYFWQVPLSSVFPCHCHVSTILDYIR